MHTIVMNTTLKFKRQNTYALTFERIESLISNITESLFLKADNHSEKFLK